MDKIRDDSPRTRVYRTVRSWVQEGKLASGERLPPEESLATMLKVSRGTVRSALKQLEDDGVLQVRKHHRRTITSEPPAVGTSLLGRTCVVLSSTYTDQESIVSGYDDAVHLSLRRSARTAGLSLLSVHPNSCTAEGVSELIRARPLGVVGSHALGVTSAGRALLTAFHAAGIPVVAHGDDPGLAPFDRVSSDSCQGMRDLVAGLVASGRRRIQRLWTTSDLYWLNERDRGFAEGCGAAGIELLPAITVLPVADRSESSSVDNLTARTRMYAGFLVEHLTGGAPPDALLATSDVDTYPLISACRMFGKQPHRDLTICGYDAYWQSCWEREFVDLDPAATVGKDNEQMGEAMMALLLDRLAGRLGSGPEHRVVPQHVVPTSF